MWEWLASAFFADQIEASKLVELVATQTLRADPACKLHLAMAAGDHGQRHRLEPLYRIGLDRGLARVCGD